MDGTPDIQVVGEANNGLEAVEMVQRLQPDVLILDMEMPGLTGSEVAARLRKEGSKVHILALSAYDDRFYVEALYELGVSGYLVKEEDPQFILEAIRGVARGEESWFSRRLVKSLAAPAKNNPSRMGLTDREMEVLRIMVSGKTNDEIAHALGISVKTVEKHLEVIFNKMKVFSRVEAAVLAVRSGLV